MLIMSWNVAGLRAAVRKGLLDFVAAAAPDILCLQEVKARPEQVPGALARLPGHTLYLNPADRPGYSGTGVLCRREPLSLDTGFDDEEGRLQVLRWPAFTLVNVYVPNGKRDQARLDYKLRFYERLLDLLRAEARANPALVLTGDINTAHREIDLARPRENRGVSGFLPAERDWLDRLEAAGFVDSFRHFHPAAVQYTWWSQVTRARERNVGWRIDYAHVSRALLPRVRRAFIMGEVTGSDHCPVGLELDGDVAGGRP